MMLFDIYCMDAHVYEGKKKTQPKLEQQNNQNKLKNKNTWSGKKGEERIKESVESSRRVSLTDFLKAEAEIGRRLF